MVKTLEQGKEKTAKLCARFQVNRDEFRARDEAQIRQQLIDSFLTEIEGWRDTLARNIALRNKELSSNDLNAAVQATIDRVVFLRMAEDRGLEPYKQLLKLCERDDVYPRFMRQLCEKADEKYNSGLFHFRRESGVSQEPDRITPKLAVDDKVFRPILQSLYFEHGSPYDFSLMPVETLGTIYERFLGKVIRLTAGHQARVEDKPEVRKAGGVYYTPTYIVDYIVKSTVGRQIKGRSPMQLAGLRNGKQPFRVLDMACGSGSFLLGAYQHLLNHCLKWYLENNPEKHKAAVWKPGPADSWRLTVGERKRILSTHIFGVDIDSQAVEVCKLSLLLKVLETETDKTLARQTQLRLFNDRALPNLAANIRCGNSLVGPDYFTGELVADADEVKRINPFDWRKGFPDAMQAGGFDCIIGNPPYLKEYVDHRQFHDLRGSRLAKYYQGKMDLWYAFSCLAIDLLKPRGLHSFIATNNWITNSGASILREKILSETRLHAFLDFGDYQVFDAAGIQTMIYVLSKSDRPHRGKVEYRRMVDSKAATGRVRDFLFKGECGDSAVSFKASIIGGDGGQPFTFVDDRAASVLKHIQEAGSHRLTADEVATGVDVHQDFVTSGHLRELRDSGARIGDGIFVLSDKEKRRLHLTALERNIIKPYFTTAELQRYYGDDKNSLWLIYTDSDAVAHIDDYPNIKAHLGKFACVITSDNRPYGLHRARDERFFLGEKIVSLRKTDRPRFTYTDFPCYVSQTFFVIKPATVNAKYLVGVLNSRLCEFWLRHKGKRQGEALQIDKAPLLDIPIRPVSPATPADKIAQERMAGLVDAMLSLHKRLSLATSAAQKAVIQRHIDATGAEIDRLVYDLYGLAAEEIAIVESATAST
jgi:adenine-specific DNA-methyltransferase